MDLLKSRKRRSKLSESAYIILNLGLALALLLIARESLSPWLAFILVLLSKFRALMVRPRFWWANLVANMPDIIVGLSVVVFLYAASAAPWLQFGIAVLYAIWLLLIKPRSKKVYVAIQAGVSVFVGITALSIVSFGWDSVFFVLAIWVIGYTATKHVLGSYDEPLTELLSLSMAVIFAELGWVGYHWLFAYPMPGFGEVKLSQLALFMTLACLVAERAYVSYHRYDRVRKQDIALPVALSVSLVVILLIFFSELTLASTSI